MKSFGDRSDGGEQPRGTRRREARRCDRLARGEGESPWRCASATGGEVCGQGGLTTKRYLRHIFDSCWTDLLAADPKSSSDLVPFGPSTVGRPRRVRGHWEVFRPPAGVDEGREDASPRVGHRGDGPAPPRMDARGSSASRARCRCAPRTRARRSCHHRTECVAPPLCCTPSKCQASARCGAPVVARRAATSARRIARRRRLPG